MLFFLKLELSLRGWVWEGKGAACAPVLVLILLVWTESVPSSKLWYYPFLKGILMFNRLVYRFRLWQWNWRTLKFHRKIGKPFLSAIKNLLELSEKGFLHG